MKFRLIEEYLYEDIDSMLKYYPTIPREKALHFISLDPTYKDGSNKAGKYAKWILGLVQKGKMDNEGHINDILARFESEKKNLKNTDIMQYKTIDSLDDMLNDENSYKNTELSHRQEVRNRQKDRKNADLSKDAEIVAKADGYTVWIPHTYAASCKLGQGAKWCTASTEDDYYYNYYKKKYGGEYYILINDSDPDEKYQFHKESKQYMNRNDNEIDLTAFLVDKQNLSDELIRLDAIPDNIKEDIDKINKLKDTGGNYIYSGEDRIDDNIKKYIKTVTIEDGVTEIPYRVFEGCNGIMSINIPDGVTYIGEDSLLRCTGLMSITIPNSVTYIGDNAFAGCTSLTRISIPNRDMFIGVGVFSGCTSLTSIKIPSGVLRIEDFEFYGCTDLTNITIPNSVKCISEGAFEKCTSLTNIEIPNSVTYIGDYAFCECKSLKSITIPNSVTEIGYYAFAKCDNLENIRIPKNLKDKRNIHFIGLKDESIVEWY